MKKGLVYGVGINDADYVVKIHEVVGYKDSGKKIEKLVWICPYYVKWTEMMRRCYSDKYKLNQPTYIGCIVVPEWHYFMAFRSWMVEQDWQGKQLDKDILSPGNKVYGPDNCVFVDQRVNNFLTERQNHRGEWPIGVSWNKSANKYQARCCDVIARKERYLGIYETPEQAHLVWLTYKLEQAKILAAQHTDPRVAKALIERYENYVAL